MTNIDQEETELETVPVLLVKKVNYLNNKDMLKEIHNSKGSFSEYTDRKYSDYDVIVEELSEIFLPESQEIGRIARAARLGHLAYAAALESAVIVTKNDKPKLSEHKIKPDTIPTEDLVYRVLTFDHIPLAPGRKKNPKSTADSHLKLNFYPFKHYIIENNEAIEVGRSHSKKGKFSLEHGSITNKLAKMFILMVNKYGQRGNWRGYCVDAETEALTKRGWLGIDDIHENDTILSYNGNNLAWSSVKSLYRGDYSGKMHKLTQQGMDSLITPYHRIVTENGLVPVELLKRSDKILMLADAVNDTLEIYNDDIVELMAWVITEGCYQFDKEGKLRSIGIYQNEGPGADRIRNCIMSLNYKYSEKIHKGNNIVFNISRTNSKELFAIIPNKNEFTDVIMNLSERQRHIFLNTLIDGDGWRTGDNKQHLRYTQKNKTHIDNVQALCAMLGLRSHSHFIDNKLSFGKSTNYYKLNIFSKKKNKTNASCINFNGGFNNGRDGLTQLGNGKLGHQNIPTEDYSGRVWCPETEYGCFVARRNDTVYLTGNTYLDEMKGQALLQLSQMGLQFDEYKSDNPFSYYTASVSNSFTRVFNLEKKNQDLRDDLLIDVGSSPSFSRQLALEGEIRRLREDAQEFAKDEHNN
jgi:hypothetical protein